jgi:hypothetical protein
MPIQTDLNVSPYFDDYDENKDYYKILFRPGVAVQARELNQFQTILQKQIERFGDHVFKRGTVVDGCDITYQSALQYVMLKDNQTDGAPINVNQLIGYYVKDTASVSPLVASIQTVVDGYESRSPDLKTIYVKYLNSGYTASAERQQFVPDDTLTVYKPSNPIEKINVSDSSAGFSNADSVVILSSVAVQNSSGGTALANNFIVGQDLRSGTANAVIVAIDTTSNSEAIILRIRPHATDLKDANPLKWTFAANTSVQGVGGAQNSNTMILTSIVGSGASAIMRTGTIEGEISSVTVTQKGSGYYVLPTVSIQSTGATTAQIGQASLAAQSFLTQVSIASATSSTFGPVGAGYGVTVGKGVIYQKGYFTRVNEHMVLVEKYSNTGFNKAVGFDTSEYILNSNQDPSLLDNATGEPNVTAPGANRLKLTPSLVTKTKAEADANSTFFSVVEFSEGNPYKQIQQTQYNILGKELARRTSEESGNYVIDPFILNTIPASTIANEQATFRISIDPGVAYLNGNRLETIRSYTTSVDKGTDTFIANNANISLNYGNYIRVNELGGIFKFNVGDLVTLYPTPRDFISGGNAGNLPSTSSPTSLGTALGTARIRSLTVESGVPGTSSCVYRLYLFDIQLATARNFSLVKSIFYNGTNKGVCDAVLEGGEAVLKDSNLSSLLYYAGRPAVKQGNNYSYVYRTIDTEGRQLTTGGLITIAATGDETFPYTPGATLSPAQEQDLIITPMANAQFAANAAGTVNCTASSTTITGGASTSFTSVFEAGDFVKIANASHSTIVQVATVVNTEVLTTTANPSAAVTDGNIVMYFPQYVPISLRSGRSASVNEAGTSLVVNLGASVNVETSVSVAYNVRSADTTPVVKGVERDKFIRLRLVDNASSNTGPWALGVPDVFHMKGVFLASNADFTPTSAGVQDVTNEYYIDHNQNEDYYGMSYLYRKSDANTAITTSNFLLVKFDYFTNSAEGLKAPGSGTGGTYTVNDGLALAASSSSINTLEIPEVYGTKGDYFDLRDQFDFRPVSVANATPNSTAASAPINPTERATADKFGTTDKKFPAPDSNLTGVIEYFQGRADRVIIDERGNFSIMKGTPGSSEAPAQPSDAMTINILQIPPYPSHPKRLSADTLAFFNNKIANETYSNRRMLAYRVSAPINDAQRTVLQPRGYTMVDIGALDRRIKALEYYVSFTLVETLTQKKVIPSSANSSIERFKFGFFVDGFNDYSYAETSNPQYNAAIVDGFLSPRVEEINLPMVPVSGGVTTSLPYIEKPFVLQFDATDGPVVVAPPPPPPPVPGTPTPPPPPPPPEPEVGNNDINTGTIVITPVTVQANTPTIVSRTISVIESEKNTLNSDSGIYYDEYLYTFSESAGSAEFFINSRDNNIGVIVYKSSTENGPFTTIVRNSGIDAQAITTPDINTHGLSVLNGGRGIEHPGSLEIKNYYFTGTSRWHEDQLKLLWQHNPDSGRYYMIRVYKGKKHGGIFGGQGKSGTYGFKLNYPADVSATETNFINGWSPTTGFDMSMFNGSWGFMGTADLAPIHFDFTGFNPASPGISPGDPGVIAAEQVFDIRITGLRPDTTHKFFIEGLDETAACKQEGRALGAGLRADSNGELRFNYYYYPTIQSLDVTSEAAAATEMVVSSKAVKIQNEDLSSISESIIQVQNYIKRVFNAPPQPAAIPSFGSEGAGSGSSDRIDNGPGGGGGGGRIDMNFEMVHWV